LAKTVKVHEDTHRALKRLKAQGRKGSLDEVIRDMIRTTTGLPVEKVARESSESRLTSYTP
jgi:predicted CopG family antitoxin